MKFLCKTFIMHCKSLLRVTAFFVALFSVTFFAVDSSASQSLRGMTLTYRVHGSGSGVYSDGYKLYYYFIGSAPTPYEAWPFLVGLKSQYETASQRTIWYDYGYLTPGYGNDPPYYYQYFSTFFNAGSIPDDWTSSDVSNINASFAALTPSQMAACTGTLTVANVVNGDTTSKVFNFNRRTPGSTYNEGVVTYDESGSLVVSYPDNTGYASGYKPNPDGTYQPTYYLFENGVATEVSYIPTQEYSVLQYDTETQTYSLNVPDYREKLDLIANKIDGISLSYDPVINVEAPSVTVTPDVTVNVSGSDLTDIESSLIGIGNILESSFGSDSYENPSLTNEVGLSSAEQLLIDRYRSWETGIPLIGSALDFGLTTLFGRLPSVGQEFVWIDMDIQPSRASRSSGSSFDGYHIRVSLDQYRDIILAFRGWIIIAEAIYFGILVWKLIREALAV